MSVYDFSAQDIQGNEQALSVYKGKVMLIVNTASKCGFTPQYEGLETLYKQYSNDGLVVLGFPCNQFGQQEKGTDTEIAGFCMKNFAHPLYSYLKTSAPGLLGSKGIKWNFTKFLVNKEGEVVKRYAPTAKPQDIASDIKKIL